ncbi:putative pectinesterase/pectinesterase inhibitor 12 [Castilleja foliolosa]|uniref:Pectinesterase n=1 Tax=Castilleja foliolosa TaxID=1961234 RepID=A0ABD3DPB8_9LAMI
MASQILKSLLLIIFFSSAHALNSSSSSSSSSSSNSLEEPHISSLTSLCQTTPYPDHCFNDLKLSLSINISPNILSFLLQSLKIAFSQALKLSDLFSNAGAKNLIEKQRGTLQDCTELHQITLSALEKSISLINSRNKLSDARAFLSAAVTNKVTCLEGLDLANGPFKPAVVDSLISTYSHISNSLSMLPSLGSPPFGGGGRRRLLGYPRWMSRKTRRVLQSSRDEYDSSEVVTVSADGKGNFTTIGDAINFAPNNSVNRIIIYIREGVYEENVEIPSWKPNIVLLGDGRDVTVISGNKSVGDGWTTFRSATLAVSGDGFLARDLTFENTAGPGKHQAVALRINADLAAVYRCTITGYQDTLYVHSFRQFYRECDIYGTIDYIFGNAAVIFQGCNIVSRMPIPGQGTVITAQSRDSPYEDTGISMQNCSVLATDDLYSNSSKVKSFLGRPWKNYSRTVLLESYVDDFIAPGGWSNWAGDQSLDTLYYGEYENYGPGSSTDGRVSWAGYHVMDYYDASNFTVSEFIAGHEWLDSTSFPYDDWL